MFSGRYLVSKFTVGPEVSIKKFMKKLLVSVLMAVGLMVCGLRSIAGNNEGHQPVIENFVVEKVTVGPPHPHAPFIYHITFIATGNGTWQLWGIGVDNASTLFNSGSVRGQDSLDFYAPGTDSDFNGLYIVAIDKKGRSHVVFPQ